MCTSCNTTNTTVHTRCSSCECPNVATLSLHESCDDTLHDATHSHNTTPAPGGVEGRVSEPHDADVEPTNTQHTTPAPAHASGVGRVTRTGEAHADAELRGGGACVVCSDGPRTHLVVPCGHFGFCEVRTPTRCLCVCVCVCACESVNRVHRHS